MDYRGLVVAGLLVLFAVLAGVGWVVGWAVRYIGVRHLGACVLLTWLSALSGCMCHRSSWRRSGLADGLRVLGYLFIAIHWPATHAPPKQNSASWSAHRAA